MAWWFNVDTKSVESEETKSPGAFLLGPYDSEAAAARALETAHDKTEAWDDADRAWDERGAPAPGGWDDADLED